MWSCILEKPSNSFVSSGANFTPEETEDTQVILSEGDRGPHQIQRFLFLIALVPISEQHLVTWQPMPHILDQQHRGLLDRFHGVFLQLFHLGHVLTSR